MGKKGWAVALLLLGVVGFVATRFLGGPASLLEAGPEDGAAVEASAPSPEGSPTGVSPGVGAEPPQQPAEPPQPGLSFGRSISGVADAGVEVQLGEGVLIVQAGPAGAGTQVLLGDRDLGEAPTRVALRGGRHELVFRRGDVVSYRFLYLRPGETRVVQAP